MPVHAEQRLLPYRPDQLFDLVADIERYPEFLPWCIGARITRREPKLIHADLIIGFRMIRERFTSRVSLDRANGRIEVAYLDGPFKYLRNRWLFEPAENDMTRLDFFVDFEFRSALLRRLIGVLFNEAVRRMVAAFEARARQLYGKPEFGLQSGPA